MKDYILNKIFIKMQDDIKVADNKYLSAKKKSYEIERKLMSELTENQKERLKELIDNLTDMTFFECKYNFYNGFKIGAKLILELLF